MIGVEAYAKCFSIPVGVSQSDRNKIVLLVDTSEVTKSERPFESRVGDWPPEIDDLEATLEKFRGLCRRKVTMNSGNGRRGGLINMNPRHRLTLVWGVINYSRSVTANCCNQTSLSTPGKASMREQEHSL